MSTITGKVVAITGASSGIGEATARLLADRGAAVVLAARRTERLDELVQAIRLGGGSAIGCATDVMLTRRASQADSSALLDAVPLRRSKPRAPRTPPSRPGGRMGVSRGRSESRPRPSEPIRVVTQVALAYDPGLASFGTVL